MTALAAAVAFTCGVGLTVAVTLAGYWRHTRAGRTVPRWPTPVAAPPSHVVVRARHDEGPR